MGILDGKRILVAGVTMDSSIGFATARVVVGQWPMPRPPSTGITAPVT